MDPPDVEMEAAPEPPAQPPVPAPAPAAAGEGWSMLSRARALLEEGKPSLALQAVRPLPLSPLRTPFRLFEYCVWRSFPPSPGRGNGEFSGFASRMLPIGSEGERSLG